MPFPLSRQHSLLGEYCISTDEFPRLKTYAVKLDRCDQHRIIIGSPKRVIVSLSRRGRVKETNSGFVLEKLHCRRALRAL